MSTLCASYGRTISSCILRMSLVLGLSAGCWPCQPRATSLTGFPLPNLALGAYFGETRSEHCGRSRKIPTSYGLGSATDGSRPCITLDLYCVQQHALGQR